MFNILVTGGAGMIGSNLVKRLVNEGNEVFVVDNLWRGKLEYLKKDSGTFIINMDSNYFDYDLSIPGIIDKLLNKIDYVIHLADIVAGINYVFSNQGDIFRQNILINSNVINSIRNSNVNGFINIGTACSFPETLQNTFDAIQLKESDLYPAQPESTYFHSKGN